MQIGPRVREKLGVNIEKRKAQNIRYIPILEQKNLAQIF